VFRDIRIATAEGEGAQSKWHPARYLTLIDFVSCAMFHRSQHQDEKQCERELDRRASHRSFTAFGTAARRDT
jgi:hypothetical protein